MYQDNITLTANDILEQEFKIDTRGYRLQEVDKFLDVVIKDYQEFMRIIKTLEKENKILLEDNKELKHQLDNIKLSIKAAKYGEKEITNMDLLRRISQLEKIVLGKDDE